MKKATLFFVLISEFLIFQNAYSEDTFFKSIQNRTLNPHVGRVVLWKFHTVPIDSNAGVDIRNIKPGFYLDSSAGKLVVVDSVLKEDFHSKEKFFLYGKEKLNELKPNAYYLILTFARCDNDKEKFWLFYPGKDNLLLDTSENRKLLSEKFDRLKMKYEYDTNYWRSGGMEIIPEKKKKRD